MVSCKFCEISKKIFFTEQLSATASVLLQFHTVTKLWWPCTMMFQTVTFQHLILLSTWWMHLQQQLMAMKLGTKNIATCKCHSECEENFLYMLLSNVLQNETWNILNNRSQQLRCRDLTKILSCSKYLAHVIQFIQKFFCCVYWLYMQALQM